MNTETIGNLQELQKPFPPGCINQLPKGGAMLDYVSHAHVTERLLEVDPMWTWEPFALDTNGLPLMEYDAQQKPVGLWIKLTVCGVTRPGYGTCEARKTEAVKELIGDALRNAAMRFGVALDLWKKETHAPTDNRNNGPQRQPERPQAPTPPQRPNTPQIGAQPQPRPRLQEVPAEPRNLSPMQELQAHFEHSGYPGAAHPQHILNALHNEGYQGNLIKPADVVRCKSLLDQHYAQDLVATGGAA